MSRSNPTSDAATERAASCPPTFLSWVSGTACTIINIEPPERAASVPPDLSPPPNDGAGSHPNAVEGPSVSAPCGDSEVQACLDQEDANGPGAAQDAVEQRAESAAKEDSEVLPSFAEQKGDSSGGASDAVKPPAESPPSGDSKHQPVEEATLYHDMGVQGLDFDNGIQDENGGWRHKITNYYSDMFEMLGEEDLQRPPFPAPKRAQKDAESSGYQTLSADALTEKLEEAKRRARILSSKVTCIIHDRGDQDTQKVHPEWHVRKLLHSQQFYNPPRFGRDGYYISAEDAYVPTLPNILLEERTELQTLPTQQISTYCPSPESERNDFIEIQPFVEFGHAGQIRYAFQEVGDAYSSNVAMDFGVHMTIPAQTQGRRADRNRRDPFKFARRGQRDNGQMPYQSNLRTPVAPPPGARGDHRTRPKFRREVPVPPTLGERRDTRIGVEYKLETPVPATQGEKSDTKRPVTAIPAQAAPAHATPAQAIPAKVASTPATPTPDRPAQGEKRDSSKKRSVGRMAGEGSSVDSISPERSQKRQKQEVHSQVASSSSASSTPQAPSKATPASTLNGASIPTPEKTPDKTPEKAPTVPAQTSNKSEHEASTKESDVIDTPDSKLARIDESDTGKATQAPVKDMSSVAKAKPAGTSTPRPIMVHTESTLKVIMPKGGLRFGLNTPKTPTPTVPKLPANKSAVVNNKNHQKENMERNTQQPQAMKNAARDQHTAQNSQAVNNVRNDQRNAQNPQAVKNVPHEQSVIRASQHIVERPQTVQQVAQGKADCPQPVFQSAQRNVRPSQALSQATQSNAQRSQNVQQVPRVKADRPQAINQTSQRKTGRPQQMHQAAQATPASRPAQQDSSASWRDRRPDPNRRKVKEGYQPYSFNRGARRH